MNSNIATISLHDIETAQYIHENVTFLLDGDKLECTQDQNNYRVNIYTGSLLTIKAKGYATKSYSINEEKLPTRVNLIRNSIIGYADSIAYNPSSLIRLFVFSHKDYEVSLFRHGNEKSLIAKSAIQKPSFQKIPDHDIVSEGLGWEQSAELQIPADMLPGLYSIKLECNSENSFSFPIIIRSTTPKNKLLILASEPTWLAYNSWGGRSRYRNFIVEPTVIFNKETSLSRHLSYIRGKLPLNFKDFLKKKIIPLISRSSKTSSITWCNYKLNWLRPMAYSGLDNDNARESFLNHLAGGEWRLLAWLEEKGVSYDYLATSDLAKCRLDSYSAVVLSTHNEYWSKEMYQELKRANSENGTWIINLSGNSINRAIEVEYDGIRYIDDFYKQVECESTLLGVRTTDGDVGTAAPYKVISQDSWLWKETGLKPGDCFGENTLNSKPETCTNYNPGLLGSGEILLGKGASGWETDKRSGSTDKEFQLLAKGKNYLGGAEMLIKEPISSCGGIFTASSITFAASLLVDEKTSRIIENLLKHILDKKQ